MHRILTRIPSPAMVVAVIALIAALSGGAYAASKFNGKNLKNGTVSSKKLKSNAVTTKKIKDLNVTTAKLADGAVTVGKIELTARTQGFVNRNPDQTALTANADTTVATLNLPAGGSYVVNASTSIGGNGGGVNVTECDLRENGNIVSSGFTQTNAAQFQGSVALTGTSTGGAVTLTCNPSPNGAQAKSRVITATRVSSIVAQ
jgi:hypothetical protein